MDERLRRLSDWNFRVSMAWLFGNSERGEVVDRRDALIVSCGLPVPEHNWSFPKSPLQDAEATIEAALGYFGQRGLGHQFLVRDHLERELAPPLEAARFRHAKSTPAMMLAPIPEPGPRPPALAIREVTTREDLVRFRDTAFEGFGLPVPAAKLFLTEPMLDLPTVRFYLGCVQDEPAASAALVATGEVAGVYWVATREAFRGRGFGTAMTWAAIRGGLELGCRKASLQASEAGLPVYERMGFLHAGTYLRFESAGSGAETSTASKGSSEAL
jgi:GNAT superfamily N-acetyltransferase